MRTLRGYDGRLGLRCWPSTGRDTPPHEMHSDDVVALRARAEGLIAAGDYGYIELSAWNFELNDWVRMETFKPD
jgi:hypothetical protein